MKISCYILIATLHMMMSWVSATSSSFAPHNAAAPPQQGRTPQHVFYSNQGVVESVQRPYYYGDQETYRGLSRLGSRPPNCEHKCTGCIPCYAIQAPAPDNQVGLQYSNYEPEDWKCKCGTSFFNP